jgi:hypothetical protein
MREVGQGGLPSEVDIMHVCISCGSQNKFVEAVAGYVERVKPKLVIINSTVSLETTQRVFERCGWVLRTLLFVVCMRV